MPRWIDPAAPTPAPQREATAMQRTLVVVAAVGVALVGAIFGLGALLDRQGGR